eukprot:scaffold386_cov135-Skeletonema_menzelii.AAC.5
MAQASTSYHCEEKGFDIRMVVALQIDLLGTAHNKVRRSGSWSEVRSQKSEEASHIHRDNGKLKIRTLSRRKNEDAPDGADSREGHNLGKSEAYNYQHCYSHIADLMRPDLDAQNDNMWRPNRM